MFSDIEQMVKRETEKTQQSLEAASEVFNFQIFELRKEMKEKAGGGSVEEVGSQMEFMKSALLKMKHAQTLLAEKMARIDYSGLQDENHFQLTCLKEQVHSIEAKLGDGGRRGSQSPLRAFFHIERPSTASTRFSGMLKGIGNNMQRGRTGLEVVGNVASANGIPLLGSSKRVNSASVGKRPPRRPAGRKKMPQVVLSTTVLEHSQDKD